MKIYAVKVNRNDTVRVVSVEVVKETPQFYIIDDARGLDWNDPRREDRSAFGYSSRVQKQNAHTTERAALEHYMARRQRDKEHAKAVVAQATKQVASANELLMHLPTSEEPQSADAVDPVAASSR